MKTCYLLLCISLTAFARPSMGGRDSCTASKQARRAQEGILNNLGDDHVIMVGRFVSKESNIYRFKTIDLWGQYNANLGFLSDIEVTSDDSSVVGCFETLRPKERYFLILNQGSAPERFTTSVSPVSVSKRNHKEKIWQKLCEISPENCVMFVYANTLPGMEGGRKTIEINPGGNVIVQCKVHSRHPLQKVTWFKDGKDIAEHGGAVYGANGIRTYDTSMRTGTRDLYIFGANTMHNGQYKCVAEDANGGSAEFITNIRLGSSGHRPCPASHKDYCMNGGTCTTITVTPFTASCKCPDGHTGDRCQHTEINAFFTGKEQQQQLKKLQSAVAALGVVLFASVVIGVILGVALVRTRRLMEKKNRAEGTIDAEAAEKGSGSFFWKQQLLVESKEGVEGKTQVRDTTVSVTSKPAVGQVRVSPRSRLKAAST